MCSLIGFIENQKLFIESEKKRVDSLSQFLSQFDQQLNDQQTIDPSEIKNTFTLQLQSNQPNVINNAQNSNNVPNIMDKSPVAQPVLQNSDNLMLSPNHELSWLRFGNYEEKRRRLAEERRKEYNEYLKEKSKTESERQKRRHISITNMPLVSNYNEILHRKRIEERKHREINGLDNIEEMHYEEEKPKESPDRGYQCNTIGWFHCSNNKFVPEYITPRSRLLASHSSRVRAAQYREELLKQIEEKKRTKAEEEERLRLEEIELERKIQEQRLKMMREYEEEHRSLRKKTDEVLKRQEISNMIPNKNIDVRPSASPLSTLRSPSYMYAREARTVASSPHKRINSKVSRSLASTMHSTVTQTKSPNIKTFVTAPSQDQDRESDQNSTSAESSSDSEHEPIDDHYQRRDFQSTSESSNKVAQTSAKSDSRIIGHLTEVRQMMQEDHLRMIEQLRAQQQSEQHLIDQILQI